MTRGAIRDSFREFALGQVVPRFAAERVRSVSLQGRIARAVSETLRECGQERGAVARAMSEFLGEECSKAMLDAYASTARAEHNIPAYRLVALAVVTRDARLLNAVLDGTGFIAVDARCEALLKRERAVELREALNAEIEEADREWRAKR